MVKKIPLNHHLKEIQKARKELLSHQLVKILVILRKTQMSRQIVMTQRMRMALVLVSSQDREKK